MKAYMYAYVGGLKNLPTWFKHGEVLEVSWEQIKELYDTGINVMLYHNKQSTDFDMGLFVDNQRFTQR